MLELIRKSTIIATVDLDIHLMHIFFSVYVWSGMPLEC